MIRGAEIVAEARRWIGTPYSHQACLFGIGCDCIGLVAGVAKALGVREADLWLTDSRFRGYGRTPKPDELLAACALYLDQINVLGACLGDILLFTFLKEPMHFGIISEVSPRYVIHAYAPVERVIENSLTGKWERRVIGAYRYRGKV